MALVVCIFLSLFATQALASQWEKDGEYIEWYQGGTLHSVSGHGWQETSQGNQLATAADFAATALAGKVSTLEELYPFANDLRACITEATRGAEIGGPIVSEIAAACITLMKW